MADSSERWSTARLMRRLPYFLLALGSIGWFGGGLVNLAGRHFIPDSIALPWSEPDALAVDSQQRLYVGLNFYNRVQVYDSNGRFVRGWFLPSEGKNYRLRMGEDQNLEAVTSGRLFRFTPLGEPLDSRALNTDVQNSLGTTCQVVDRSSGRTVRYEIRGRPLYPHVKRIESSGEQTTVASTPGHVWPLQCVLPAFAWAACGILVLACRRLLYHQIA